MGSTGVALAQSSVGTFKEGDTARAIREDANYKVSRLMADGTERDYGRLPGEDVKLMVKGYKFNGVFWEKSGAKNIYLVDELD